MDCLHIPTLSYSAFAQRLYSKATDGRLPIAGSLELTFRCNLRCAHCYLNHEHQAVTGQRELAYDEICAILDQVADAGCLWLLLTGGEPLVRPDFLDIYHYARRKGLLVTIFTNGTLITPALADALAEWRPFSVEITLYGRTQETYERVTGIPGSHARCLRGIDLLLERGIPLKLKTMLMTLNAHELWDMKAYAESLGVEFRFDPMLNAGLDGSAVPVTLRLPPEQAVAFDLADAERKKSWLEFCERFVGPPADQEHLYTCGAGLTSFHIDPYGQLAVCMLAREPQYDLRQGSFRQGWQEFLVEVRQQKRTRESRCSHCDLASLCGQCPGWGQVEHDNQEQAVDYLCKVAHLRAMAFGIKRAGIRQEMQL
jgi:radical SAM protein with 4Fe4S-binding SPASM domain